MPTTTMGRRACDRSRPRGYRALAYHVAANASRRCAHAISHVIKDVATTGNSGSGVFDAGGKCLLGIMSRKILIRPNGADGETRDIAKYFVPAATIAAFIPKEYHF